MSPKQELLKVYISMDKHNDVDYINDLFIRHGLQKNNFKVRNNIISDVSGNSQMYACKIDSSSQTSKNFQFLPEITYGETTVQMNSYVDNHKILKKPLSNEKTQFDQILCTDCRFY